MGKSGRKPKVPWYYRSTHLGICHGPIDALNQVLIKDKPIFCGEMTEEGSVYVHLPELFGGEEKEGGVSGVIDVRMGDWTQTVSPPLANRLGRTEATMPGFRGFAHIFLRGYEPEEEQYKPEEGGMIQYLAQLLSGKAWPLLKQRIEEANRAATKGGFLWAINNPFMAPVAAHVTRIGKPDALDRQYDVIRPVPIDETTTLTGEFKTSYNSASTEYTDIDVAGFAESIDLGTGSYTASMRFRVFMKPGTNETEGSAGIVINTTFFDANGKELVDTTDPHGDADGFYDAEGTYTANTNTNIPAGTRTIRVYGLLQPVLVLTTAVEALDTAWGVSIQMLGPPLCGVDGEAGQRPDMNPASIIYECLTDPDWGRGEPASAIDAASFNAAAQTLHAEKFGLSLMWAKQTTIQAFINEVLDHIQATLYMNPMTGLWTLKLIRNDYTLENAPKLHPGNCKLTGRKRRALGETVNEIIVTWTNPNNEKEETVTAHDLANIAAQGDLVSSSRNYYGVRSLELANKLAQRDIREAAYPLWTGTAEITLFKDASGKPVRPLPGDVLSLDWPEDGITNMPVRVMKVDKGKRNASSVKVELAEDIFGLEHGEYGAVERSAWEDPNTAPDGFAQASLFTPPLPLLMSNGVLAAADATDDRYPETVLSALAYEPSIDRFQIWQSQMDTTGRLNFEKIGVEAPTYGAGLAFDLVAEPRSLLSDVVVRGIARYLDPEPGDMLMVGSTDGESEFIMLDVFDAKNREWLVSRGMYDTVPRAWPAGTFAWFIGNTIPAALPIEVSAGDSETVSLVPRNGTEGPRPKDSPEYTTTPTDRLYAPFRPAAVTVEPVGGTLPTYTYPTDLRNGNADTGDLLYWTTTGGMTVYTDRAQSVLQSTGEYSVVEARVKPRSGTHFFYGGANATSRMSQRLSVPKGRRSAAKDGTLDVSLRWYQTSYSNTDDPGHGELIFYDDGLVELGRATAESVVAGARWDDVEVWRYRSLQARAPAGTTVVEVALVATLVEGSVANAGFEDISFNWYPEVRPVLSFVGDGIPNSLTVGWANRNRLQEDAVPARWDEPNVTPETDQTTHIRLVSDATGDVVVDAPSVTGTSYSLDTTAPLDYRTYTLEVYSERAGFVSIQKTTFPLEIIRLGYGNNYGYDYGENDGD